MIFRGLTLASRDSRWEHDEDLRRFGLDPDPWGRTEEDWRIPEHTDPAQGVVWTGKRWEPLTVDEDGEA